MESTENNNGSNGVPPPPPSRSSQGSIPPPPPPPSSLKKKDQPSAQQQSVSSSVPPVTSAPSVSEGGTSGLANTGSAQQPFQWNPEEAQKQYEQGAGIKTSLGNKIKTPTKSLSVSTSTAAPKLGYNAEIASIQQKLNKDAEVKSLVDQYDSYKLERSGDPLASDDARNTSGFYLDYIKKNAPDEYNYVTSKFGELQKEGDPLKIQRFEAELMKKGSGLKAKVFSGKYQIARNAIQNNYSETLKKASEIDSKIQSSMDEISSLNQQVSSFRKDQNGNIIIDPSNRKEVESTLELFKNKQDELNSLLNEKKSIESNQDFMDAINILDDVQNKYQSLSDTYYKMAKDDPDAFKGLPEYKRLIERKQAAKEAKDIAEMTTGGDFGVQESAARAVTSFLAKMAFVPKSLTANDQYGWTDKFADNVKNLVDDFNDEKIPLPSEYDKPVYKDGTWNIKYLPGKVAGTAIDMGLMALPAIATEGTIGGLLARAGVSGDITSAMGTVVSGYTMTAADYYAQAKEAGMSEKGAISYARTLASQQALLELVSPNKDIISPKISAGKLDDFAKMIATGATEKDAIAETVKSIINSNIKEVAQEELQTLDEISNRYTANELSGVNDNIRESISNEMIETAVLTALTTSIIGGGSSIKTKSQLNEEALYMAAHSPDKMMEAVDGLVSSGAMMQEVGDIIKKKVTTASIALSKMDNALPENKKMSALRPMMEKIDLEEKAKTVDEAFKDKINNDIQAKTEEIKSVISGTEQEKKSDTLSNEETEELQDLQYLKDNFGLSNDEQTRYDQLIGKAKEYDNDAKKIQEQQKAEEQGQNVPNAKEVETIKTEQNATKEGIITEGDKPQYQEGAESRETTQASDSDSAVSGGEVQQEKPVEEKPTRKAIVTEDFGGKNGTSVEIISQTEVGGENKYLVRFPNGVEIWTNEPSIKSIEGETEVQAEAGVAPEKAPEQEKPILSRNGKYQIVPSKGTNRADVVWNTGKKKGQPVSVVTQRRILRDYAEDFDYDQGKRAEIEEGMPEKKIQDVIMQTSENPLELIALYTELSGNNEDSFLDQLMYENISNVDPESFVRFSDANHIWEKGKRGSTRTKVGNALFAGYLREKGPKRKLDAIAEEISDLYGREVTPDQLVEYMLNNPWRNPRYNDPRLKTVSDKFTSITGLPLNKYTIEAAFKNEAKKKVQINIEEDQKVQELLNKEYESIEQAEREFYEAIAKGDISIEEITGTEQGDSQVQEGETVAEPGKGVEGVEKQKVKIGGKEYYVDIDNNDIGTYTSVETGTELPKNTERYRTAEYNRKKKEGKIKEEKPVVEEPEEPVKKPIEKQKEEGIIDIEDKEDLSKKDDLESIKTLDNDIEVLKKISPASIVKKYNATINKINKMVEEKKISKRTANAYKSDLGDVYEGRVDAIKAGVIKVAEDIKRAILGDYRGRVYSSVLPVAPKMVADLIDLVAKGVVKGIDAGLSLQSAIDKAVTSVKSHPRYIKLVEDGTLNEGEFEKEVRARFSEAEDVEEESGDGGKEPPKEKPQKEKKSSGGKKMRTAKRIVEGAFSNEDVKEGLEEEGYDYIPRNIKATEQDAENYIRFFNDNDQLDKAFDHIKDLGNGMDMTTRGAISVALYRAYVKKSDSAKDPETKAEFTKKAVAVAKFGSKLTNIAGQAASIVGKMYKVASESSYETVIALLESQNEEEISKMLGGKVIGAKIRNAKKAINKEWAKKESPEDLSKAVDEEINKRLLRVVPKETVKKIDDFFNKLKIGRNKLFSDATGLLAIASTTWDTAMSLIQGSIKLGISAYNGVITNDAINNAVEDGLDYIKKNHKEKFDEDVFRSKVGSEIREGLKEAGVKIKNTAKTKKKEEAVSSVIEKKFSNLSEKGKQKLVSNVVTELDENGSITESKFKKLYAEAIGADMLTPEMMEDIKGHVETLKQAEKKRDELKSILDEWAKDKKQHALEGKEYPAQKEKDFNDKAKKAIREMQSAVLTAEEANEKISQYFRGPKDFWKMLSGVHQGNLLTPLSVMVNIAGYPFAYALRGSAYGLATILDYGQSKLSSLAGVKSIDPERKTDVASSVYYGLKYGAPYGIREAIRRLKTGSINEDLSKRELSQQMNAPKALYDFFSKLGTKERRNVETKLTNFIEGTFGLPADAMFRLLNLGDKPPRRMAEFARAAELAKQKGLSGPEFLNFVFLPDAETKAEMIKAGEKAAYQQDNIVSQSIEHGMGLLYNQLGKIPFIGRHIAGLVRMLKGSIIPFVKTPANIILETIDYTVPFSGLIKGTIASLKGDRRSANLNFSKAFIASGLGYVAYQFVMNGLITAGADDDEKEKEKRAQYENIKPYSMNFSALMRLMSGDKNWATIKDKDTWINYQKMGTMGMAMGAWANLYKEQSKEQITDRNHFYDLMSIILPTMKASFEQSFLKGTNDALTALYSGGKKADYFFVNQLVSLSSTFYPNTAAALSRSSDPFIRDKRTDEGVGKMLENAFRDRMFMGNTLPTKVSLWGEKVINAPKGTNPYVYYFLDPVKSYNIDTQVFGYKVFEAWKNSIDKENKNRMLPSPPTDEVNIGGQKIKLSHQEYEEYQMMVGKERSAEAEKYVLYGDFDSHDEETRSRKLSAIYESARLRAKHNFIMSNPRLLKIKDGI